MAAPPSSDGTVHHSVTRSSPAVTLSGGRAGGGCWVLRDASPDTRLIPVRQVHGSHPEGVGRPVVEAGNGIGPGGRDVRVDLDIAVGECRSSSRRSPFRRAAGTGTCCWSRSYSGSVHFSSTSPPWTGAVSHEVRRRIWPSRSAWRRLPSDASPTRALVAVAVPGADGGSNTSGRS